MENQRNNAVQLDYSQYAGYLKPFVPLIVEYWTKGLSCARIADAIRPVVRERLGGSGLGYHGWEYYVSDQNVRYILTRIVATEDISPHVIKHRDRHATIITMAHDGATLQQIKDKIGLSRERIRQIIKRHKERMLRKDYIERRLQRLDYIIAEEQRALLRSRLGRPLDMGGPRDVWIEQSPWDEH